MENNDTDWQFIWYINSYAVFLLNSSNSLFPKVATWHQPYQIKNLLFPCLFNKSFYLDTTCHLNSREAIVALFLHALKEFKVILRLQPFWETLASFPSLPKYKTFHMIRFLHALFYHRSTEDEIPDRNANNVFQKCKNTAHFSKTGTRWQNLETCITKSMLVSHNKPFSVRSLAQRILLRSSKFKFFIQAYVLNTNKQCRRCREPIVGQCLYYLHILNFSLVCLFCASGRRSSQRLSSRTKDFCYILYYMKPK